MSNEPRLKSVVVGCRMGSGHARAMIDSGQYELAALCDLNEQTARQAAARLRAPEPRVYTDFAQMLDAERPDVVTVATPNDSHCALTLQAAEFGVRAICAEKPMAVNLGQGRQMVETCRRRGVRLTVNHQRRLKADLLMARRLIEAGAVGQVYLLRATHAGDVLSDGTHAVDSLRHLAGDRPAKWVFGAIHRRTPREGEPKGMGYDASGGCRYGHAIESAAMATWEFEGGLRAEVLSGELRFPGRPYQDYEVLGTQGRLWRVGDRYETPVLIENHEGRGFRVVDLDPAELARDPMAESYRLLARQVREGGEHPLSGESGLDDLEIVMAIYESARLRQPVSLPLNQDEYPLELMVRDGQA